jgi:hypothetical protein
LFISIFDSVIVLPFFVDVSFTILYQNIAILHQRLLKFSNIILCSCAMLSLLDNFSDSNIANDDSILNNNLQVGVFSIVSVADLNKYQASSKLNIL